MSDDTVSLTIDDREIRIEAGTTLLEAAQAAGIYIPRLCYHPDLPTAAGLRPADTVYRGEQRFDSDGRDQEFEGCQLCIVEIEGWSEFARACDTPVEQGMAVYTNTSELQAQRRDNLVPFLVHHPHACLTCAQREGCSRTQCSANVPEPERCCPLLGNCELQRVAEYVGVREDIPRYVPAGYPLLDEEPLFVRDYDLCIGCLRCVRACGELRGVDALSFVYAPDGEIVVGTVAPSLSQAACRFCTACVEVCPTGALMDRRPDGTVGSYKQGERDAALVPCRAACPAATDVPRYVRLVGQGRYAEAAAVVRERAPFPAVLGHVCFHPCEDVCRRGEVNTAVSIAAIKRCAGERDDGLWHERLQADPPTGRRVGVVGAGPAGLTAAFCLALKGHAVTLFEAEEEPGGMLRYGIPAFRLPRDVLRQEVSDILGHGIELRTDTRVGRDIAFEELRADCDAVVVAVGLQLSSKLEVPGAELDGVLWGLEFLRAVNTGRPPAIGQRIAVVGGGGVAMDVALTARRLGATDVQLVCLEARHEMPAYEREIAMAVEEGVAVHPLWGPQRILGDGQVGGIELVRCLSVFDAAGRFSPTFDESATTVLEADTAIFAIGQAADLGFLNGRRLEPDPETGVTALPGIFAAGDVAGGDLSVVHAVASGRRAAEAVDRHLGGDGDLVRSLVTLETPASRLGRIEGFGELPRAAMPALPLTERSGFNLVELGLTEEAAMAEAERCLQCDLRLQLGANPHPPEDWLPLDAEHAARVPAVEGVYQLLNAAKEVFHIAGTMNLRGDLEGHLANEDACFFTWEADPMYTKRESELIQQFLQQYGHLPGAGDELDDLYDDDLF
ncbi:MAG: FAD-dependent oxidoreductase [Anaerolineae bacterium]|jgi:NADPH-dependent glutamate synthase beta subunit-like oxidoreductase